MSTRKKDYYDIVNGPNRDKLFDAVKYAYDQSSRVTVDLSVAEGYTAPKDCPGAAYSRLNLKVINIFNISWLSQGELEFGGVCIVKPEFTWVNKAPRPGKCRFVAHYDTWTRKGKIWFE